jgi:hypothetical protein
MADVSNPKHSPKRAAGKSEHGGSPVDGPANQTISPEIRDLRSRKVYLQVRMPKVRAELKELADRRRQWSEDSKKGPKAEGPAAKSLNEQRIYTVHELGRLQAELKALTEERKNVLEKLKTAKDK